MTRCFVSFAIAFCLFYDDDDGDDDDPRRRRRRRRKGERDIRRICRKKKPATCVCVCVLCALCFCFCCFVGLSRKVWKRGGKRGREGKVAPGVFFSSSCFSSSSSSPHKSDNPMPRYYAALPPCSIKTLSNSCRSTAAVCSSPDITHTCIHTCTCTYTHSNDSKPPSVDWIPPN